LELAQGAREQGAEKPIEAPSLHEAQQVEGPPQAPRSRKHPTQGERLDPLRPPASQSCQLELGSRRFEETPELDP
jgi:hypothetical protein